MPLQPFSPPTALFSQLHLTGTFSGGTLMVWALYLVFAFWAIYTLVAIYHWMRYSHAALIAIPAMLVHVAVSIALMSYALSANGFFLASLLPS